MHFELGNNSDHCQNLTTELEHDCKCHTCDGKFLTCSTSMLLPCVYAYHRKYKLVDLTNHCNWLFILHTIQDETLSSKHQLFH